MKRSEMLQVIINATETYRRGTLNLTKETYADFLLTQIELAGMMPPINDWSLHTDGDKANPDNIQHYKWEKEDEKK